MSIDDDFFAFHQQNPEVYAELVRLAHTAKSAGRDKVGMKMLFEVVRWSRYIQTTGTDFKLNNNYTSRYSRLIMEQETDLREMFEVRGLKT